MHRSSSGHRGLPLVTLVALLASVAIVATALVHQDRKQRLTRRYVQTLEAEPPQPQTLRLLLKQGADPRTRSLTGRTLLMVAAEANDRDLMAQALAADPDPNQRDQSGRSALEYAVQAAQGREEFTGVVQTLVQNGADLNAVAMAVGGPLVTAASNGNTEIVQVLVAAGAGVDQQDFQGYTPLFWAALHGQVRTVEALLTAGADPSIRARDGLTAAEEVRLRCAEKLKAMRRAGAPKQELAAVTKTCQSVLQVLR